MPERTVRGLRFHTQELVGIRGAGTAAPGTAAPGTGPTGAGTAGDRPAVVLLHGLVADNLSSWYYTIANPLALDADVYLYDLRGHGRSEMPDSGYSIAENVADLVALLDEWGLDRPVHLVGNSFGGAIALATAIAHPDRVASLLLIEAHFATAGWGEHMAGSLALAAFGLDEDNVQAWLEEHGGRKLNRLARRAETLFLETSLIDDLQAEQPVARADLEAIDVGVLALYGEHSDILDRAHELATHVSGCELHVIGGCTHSVLTEATPRVRDLALDWIVGGRATRDRPGSHTAFGGTAALAASGIGTAPGATG